MYSSRAIVWVVTLSAKWAQFCDVALRFICEFPEIFSSELLIFLWGWRSTFACLFFPWHAFGMCSFILSVFLHASGAFSFCEIWSVRKVTAKVCKTRFLTSESLKLRESYKEEKKQNVEVIVACIFCTFFIEDLRRDPIIHLKALVLLTLKYTVADKQIYLCNVIKRT